MKQNLQPRWGKVLGLATKTLAGAMVTVLAAAGSVLALTPEEAARRLNSIPIFGVFNPQNGSPLLSTATVEGKQVPLMHSFFDRQEAEQWLQQVKAKNTSLGNAQIQPMLLGEVLVQVLAMKNKPDGLQVLFIPDTDEVKAATAMVQANPQNKSPWQGVPIFYVPNLMISAQQGNNTPARQVMPMYFSRQDLQTALEEAKKQDPKLASTQLKIEVVNLEQVLQLMTSDKSKDLPPMIFIPSRQTYDYVVQYIRSQRPANSTAPAGGNRPAGQGTAQPNRPAQPGRAPAQPGRPANR